MTFDEWFETVDVEASDNCDHGIDLWDLENWMRAAWDEAKATEETTDESK
jgi:hypothetical protein